MANAIAEAHGRVEGSLHAHQLIVSTSLVDAPLIEYTNQVTMFDRTDPVTDQHDSSLISQLKQCLPQ